MREPIPSGNKRACLCRDGETYSIECCGEDYFSQGIGNVTASFVGGVLQDSDGTISQTDTSQSLGSTNTTPLPGSGGGSSTVTNIDTERSFENSTDTTDDDGGGSGLPTTTTTTLPIFSCSDAVFVMSDGNVGDSTSGQGSVSRGTITSITPSTYSVGSNVYTASITAPSGFSNEGSSIDCTDSATGSQPTFTCSDAVFSMADGTTGASTVGQGTVTLGTIVSISPSTYSSGSDTYTATITVPSGYSNSGSTIDCTDDAVGGFTAFTCSDANFFMASGVTNQPTAGLGTVSLGTITSISPSTYQDGEYQYTATITVPSGYSNAGQSINCTAYATGTEYGWFANANNYNDGFSSRSDACSGGFADQTHIRFHFKNGSGTIQYPTTVDNIIDGGIDESGGLVLYEDDGTGYPSNNKVRGGALFFGLVYKAVSDKMVDEDPEVTLIALGSSTDVPQWNAEGLYSSAQTCTP